VASRSILTNHLLNANGWPFQRSTCVIIIVSELTFSTPIHIILYDRLKSLQINSYCDCFSMQFKALFYFSLGKIGFRRMIRFFLSGVAMSAVGTSDRYRKIKSYLKDMAYRHRNHRKTVEPPPCHTLKRYMKLPP